MTTTDHVTYRNGNCTVSIWPDGTKTRTVNDGEDALPLWPESIDLKITDYCDAGCAWCHEKSTKKGAHADFGTLVRITAGMRAHTELAIGGGNPLDHPDLSTFLIGTTHADNLIANLTVNARHIDMFSQTIAHLRLYKLVRGLGVSYNKDNHDDVVGIADENTVVHVIAGVDRPETVLGLMQQGIKKFLILGYKDFGRGILHRQKLKSSASIDRWRYFLPSILSREGTIVSFDNLGLEQLQVRKLIGEELWLKSYMGDDGTYTMYIDAVREEYAATSTSTRYPIGNLSVREMFAAVRARVGLKTYEVSE